MRGPRVPRGGKNMYSCNGMTRCCNMGKCAEVRSVRLNCINYHKGGFYIACIVTPVFGFDSFTLRVMVSIMHNGHSGVNQSRMRQTM